MKTTRSSKGFTLIELLIVITIIGILAVALLPSVLGAPARARDAARKADINNIIAALETFNSDNQHYPTAKICFGKGDAPDDEIAAYFQGQKSPVDPQGASATKAVGGCDKGQYVYCPLTSPKNYFVMANMEIKGDGNVKASTTTDCTEPNSTTNPSADGDSAWFVTK